LLWPPRRLSNRSGPIKGASVRRRLKILYVVESTFAGTGRHVLDLITAMLERGHEVHIAYSPVRMDERFARDLRAFERLHVLSLPMRPMPGVADLWGSLKVRRYLQQHGPMDVVHGHSSKGGAIARIASWGLGSRRVYTAHAFKTMDPCLGRVRRSVFASIELVLGRFASDAVIAVSLDEARHARELGIPAGRCRIVPNAVRIPPDLPDRTSARRQLGVPAAAPCLLFVGRLDTQKAPDRFVSLAASLLRDFRDLHALMLGSGPLEAAVRLRIERAGLKERVLLHTNQRGWDGMAAADLLVLTSHYEGMPYVLLEAAALGLPIVSTEVGGARQIVRDGQNGLVVPQRDAAALHSAATKVLGNHSAFAGRIAAAWTFDDMIAATLAVYREDYPAPPIRLTPAASAAA
jgi:glycosyltransferase involved in cell wall biosynthesis